MEETLRKVTVSFAAFAAVCSASAIVFPTNPHAANNFIPFASGNTTMHQVFASSLFSAQTGGQQALISSIAFAPGVNGSFNLGQVTINRGYTNAIPGQGSGTGGLQVPTSGGGGNNVGAMTTFYSNPATAFNFVGQSSSNFQMAFLGTPFVYDPNVANLLVEIIVPIPGNTTLAVSRAAGSAESSRSYTSATFGDAALGTTAT